MPIVPDTKDWTWVIQRRCPDCGFDASTLPREGVAPLLRENAETWQRALAGDPDQVTRRPSDDRWSTLEYACHVRDVFRICNRRLQRMLTEDGPLFANWDQDATAVADRYGEQDPEVVARELTEAATVLAAGFQRVQGDQWDRPGTRSDGARFTVDTFARYVVHDPVHHLWDVGAA